MFCSRCGKTLNPEVPSCPHCGVAVGESRMSGHTSAQMRYSPREQKQEPAKYTPYTKTTYTSMDNTDEDVYSRTSYRPVLAVANVPEPIEDESDESDEADVATPDAPFPGLKLSDSEVSPQQRASLEKLQAVPDDAPDPEEAQKILEKELDIRVRPPQPIRKTGISPEVEGYIQRMEALKNKGRKRRDEEEGEPLGDEAAEAGEGIEAAALPADERLARKATKLRDKALRQASPVGKWVKRITAVAAIAVVLVGGLVYLSMMTQPKSPIVGVSKQLYDAGLQLITARTLPAYRVSIVNLFKTDSTAMAAMEQQAKDLEEINALKADSPLENDALFVTTLAEIQKSINVATTTDAMAALNPDDKSRAEMQAQSETQWDIINNAKIRLETATDIKDLNSINKDVDEVNATPAPTPTPEPPAEYPNLKRDSKGAAVKELQSRLAELGWFNGGVRDGRYGTFTAQSVSRFQQAAGLKVDGIANNETQQLLYSSAAPTFTPGAQVGAAPVSVTTNTEPTPDAQATNPPDDAIK